MKRRTFLQLSTCGSLGISGCLGATRQETPQSSTAERSRIDEAFSLLVSVESVADESSPGVLRIAIENTSSDDQTVWAAPTFPFSSFIAYESGEGTGSDAHRIQLVPVDDSVYSVYGTAPEAPEEPEFAVVPTDREGACWNALNAAHVPDSLERYNIESGGVIARPYFVLSYTNDRSCVPTGEYTLSGLFFRGDAREERVDWSTRLRYPL
ncbi:hypothetical protein [Haloarchaeobius sp. DYHT-AS-18]|uniref:hypothetical protein n=1 Tax=Haloarchaeobius sp. DYHT-AS-18 TaxID=3446117 RepID=UPI003EB6FEBC